MKLTEIFNGTPALFYAQMQEFESDSFDGERVAVDLVEPMRPIPSNDPQLGFVGKPGQPTIMDIVRGVMAQANTRYEPDINSTTPRVVLNIENIDNWCRFTITATLRPQGDTAFATRLADDAITAIKTWYQIVGYLQENGWCAKVTTESIDKSVLQSLSREEYDTLQLIVDGLNQQQIAQYESVGVDAIKKRKQRIAEKLGIDGNATLNKLRNQGIKLGITPNTETILKLTPNG